MTDPNVQTPIEEQIEGNEIEETTGIEEDDDDDDDF